MSVKLLVLSSFLVGAIASSAVLANPANRKPTSAAAPTLSEDHRRMFCGDPNQPDTSLAYAAQVSAELDHLVKPRVGKPMTVGEAMDAMKVKYCGRGQS